MGNRQSAPGRPSGTALLLGFLDDPPNEEAVRTVYGSWEQLQKGLSVRLPRSFTTDICEFKEILTLATSAEGVLEELEDATCNLVTAAVARMAKPEKLFAVLASIGSVPVRAMDGAGIELVQKIYWTLRVIVYSCGGDPVNFSNATVWMKRFHLVHTALEYCQTVLSDDFEMEVEQLVPAFGANDTLEGAMLESTTRLALYLVDRKRYAQGEQLTRMALEACQRVFIAPPTECVPLLNLALGIALVGGEKSPEAIRYFTSFVVTVDKSALTILLGNSDFANVTEVAALYVMGRPEIATSNVVVMNIGRRLLMTVPKRVTSLEDLSLDGRTFLNARDQIGEMLVGAFALEGHFGAAHDQLLTLGDGLRRTKMLKQLVRMMIDQGAQELICHLLWGEEEQTVASLLGSMGQFGLLYKFHCTRGDLRSAATAQYRAADCAAQQEEYEKLHDCLVLALNCLLLSKDCDPWISVDQRLVDVSILRSEILKAKAFVVLNSATHSTLRELIFRVLRDQHLSLAIEMVLDNSADCWDLVVDFLVDSLVDASRLEEIERPWLASVFRIFNLVENEFPELDVLQALLGKLDRSDAFLGCASMMLRYGLTLPGWLVDGCERTDCNGFVRLLGQREQLDLIVTVLRDDRMRDRLSPGTLAYLQIVSQA
ncbi:hypothetical protein PSACC_00052 [Paramicrosporidium saccamoebae]|uniref:NUP160 middle TPR domain-containing protein n=1 Tax=Paramicrosporidium saccamoebae TaxID=1246581 RepID=A0A2H9TQW3_9FUNG|nr:hypothetical protein PSACC_00052 [Paramicrosporidium saccamoebae]